MRKILLLITTIFFLLEAYLSLASMPVEVKITGCIEKGYLYSEEIDFGTHSSSGKYKISTGDKDLNPVSLFSYEGKRVKISGYLLPGNTFIVEQNSIKVLGWCKNKKKSSIEKDIPEKGNLSSNGNDKMIGEDQAQRIVWGLPEVKQHSARVKSMGKRLFTRIDTRFESKSCENFFYIIYLGEDHGTHAVNLMTFYVNAYTKEIYVYDPIADTKYPIEQWRIMQK